MRALRQAGCVWAEDEAALLVASADGAELDARVARRVAGEPLEYVLGWADFAGVRVTVRAGVFVPRHRSEALVDAAVPLLRAAATGRRAVLVDLCCGTGALGLAAARRAGVDVELHAADVDPVAVECAGENLAGVPHTVVTCGDLFQALDGDVRGRVDVLIANVPYVPSGAIATLPREFRDHERRATLDGGVDGLDLARRVLAQASAWLRPGGTVLMEASPDQAGVLAGEDFPLGVTATVDEDTATAVVRATAADSPLGGLGRLGG